MNIFDQAGREGIRLDPPGQIAWLLGSSLTWRFAGWLPTHTTDAPGGADLYNDLVAEMIHGGGTEPPWAILIEVQSSPDPDMLARLTEYIGRQEQALRHGPHGHDRYQVGAALLNLTGRGLPLKAERRLDGTAVAFTLSVGGHNVAELKASDVLADIAAARTVLSVLLWVPLMEGSAEPAMLDEWKRLVASQTDSRRRAGYVTLAQILVDLTDVAVEWKKALEGFNVTESPFANSLIAVGEAKGEVKGELRASRRALLTVLRSRFGQQVTSQQEQRIEAEDDPARLTRWLELAVSCASLQDFDAAL